MRFKILAVDNREVVYSFEWEPLHWKLAIEEGNGKVLVEVELSNAPLSFADLREYMFNGANIAGAVLDYAVLTSASLNGVQGRGMRAIGADFSAITWELADFTEACFDGATFCKSFAYQPILSHASFRRANLSQAVLVSIDAAGASFRGANLRGAKLSGCLTNACFVGVNLRGASLHLEDASGADWTGAIYDDETEFPAGLDPQGQGMLYVGPGAELRHARLCRFDLSEANLERASLSEAVLTVSDLRQAKLRHADLAGAHLQGACLAGANLTNASLAGAHLVGASLRAANLAGADLCGASLNDADLTGADLTGARHDKDTIWPRGFTPAR